MRLIKTILSLYITPSILLPNHPFSSSGLYYSLPPADQSEYIRYISSLPLDPAPEAFGLHENAAITNAQNETRELLETILGVQPRSGGGGGKSREEVIFEIAEQVEGRRPAGFDAKEVFERYPTEYGESMNTVLVQEVIR